MNNFAMPKRQSPNPEEACARQWSEPVPLPHCISPVKPLLEKMIPAVLRRWLLDSAERMQVPPDFAAAAAVVAFGTIIGRGCGIYPKRVDNWLVVPNLWGFVVGRPSLMKSPSVSEGFAPLHALESEARDTYIQAEVEQQFASKIIKMNDALLTEELKRVLKAGNNDEIDRIRQKMMDLQAETPTRRRFQTQDGTTEKIGEILIDNPRGLLVLRDELVAWFKTLDKDGREGDRAFFLEGWSGNQSFVYDRIGRGTLDVPALCLSVFGAITPGPLSTYVHQAVKGGIGDDGLLQRFQIAVWPDSPVEWNNVDRKPDWEAREKVFKIAKMLSADIAIASLEEGAQIPALRFSPEGQEIFDYWRFKLETRIRGELRLPPAMESHLTKYRKLMPALALIFHLVAVVDGSAEGLVSGEAALMAIEWCDYLETHAVRIYGTGTMPGLEQARELVKHIKRGAILDGCKPKDIYRHHWTKLTTPDDVKVGLEFLEQYDWLCVEKIPTGGKPSEVVRLNPLILTAEQSV